MLRRLLVFSILLSMVVLVGTRSAQAGPRLDAKTMKVGLKTESAEEDGFIDKIVALTDQGTLPRAVTNGVFDWAKKKPRHKFQYFKRGILDYAAQLGVHIR